MSDLREFKAWFKGFKENIKKPTEAQWKRVCEEIEKLESSAPNGLPYKSTDEAVRQMSANLKVVPGDPAIDPRFTPETMPKRALNPGAAMDAGVPKK